jgi:hypothetical protein
MNLVKAFLTSIGSPDFGTHQVDLEGTPGGQIHCGRLRAIPDGRYYLKLITGEEFYVSVHGQHWGNA